MTGNGLPQLPTTRCCTHTRLTVGPSTHATEAGYQRPSAQQRAAAVTPQGQVRVPLNDKNEANEPVDRAAFPAPLLLPGDDLALDPRYPPQSLRAWLREKNRNKVTSERRTIYVAAPPTVDPEVEFVHSWSKPAVRTTTAGETAVTIMPPNVKDVVRYLTAFYHGLPVKSLPSELRFAAWDGDPPPPPSKRGKKQRKGKPQSSSIALNTHSESIRIRTRRRPSQSSAYPRQLNLDDLLDGAVAVLPTDAYALLLLVEHDLFEDEDDEFVCGRAYGGSRVAVVSSARYHPAFDAEHGVEREHAWPASHCDAYVRELCAVQGLSAQRQKQGKKVTGAKMEHISTISSSDLDPHEPVPPYLAALNSHTSHPSPSSTLKSLSALYLSRVCKTSSHELGHCLGIDHCVYYACVMQGSASLAEDARQPPYLCPIDDAKVAAATGKGARERGVAMRELLVCEEEQGEGGEGVWGKGGMFGALGAWLGQDVGL